MTLSQEQSRSWWGRLFSGIDWLMFGALMPIVAAGLVTMTSFGGTGNYFEKQLTFAIISVVVFFVFSFVDWRFLRRSEVLVGLFLFSLGRFIAVEFYRKISLNTFMKFSLYSFGGWLVGFFGTEWDAFLASATADGKTVLREQDMEESQAMAKALRANPHVRAIIDEAGAMFETPLQWTDPGTGIKCKMLGDIIAPKSRILADLKTARSIEIRRFGAAIATLGYHGQLAHYERGVAHALGWVPRRVSIIAVEKTAPYDVAVFDLETDVRDAGGEMVTRLMGELAECRETNRWPGRYVEPVTLSANNLPPWIFGGSGLPDMGFTQED
jgi:hypothetical protein